MTNNSLTLSQLKALVAPQTHEVFELFRDNGVLTVGQAQELLAMPSKTLFYQVAKLVKVGLLIPDKPQRGRRREAASYRPVSKIVRMPDGFQGAEYELRAAKMVGAQLRKMIRRFEAAAQAQEVDGLFVLNTRLKLSTTRLQKLKDRMKALLKEFRDEEGEHDLQAMVTFAPRRVSGSPAPLAEE